MTFDEVLAQVREVLEREGRVSYRALKRRFGLDDDYKFPVMASNPWEMFKTPWIAGTEPQIPPSPDVLVRGVSRSQDPKVTNKKQSGKVDNAYLSVTRPHGER